MSNVEEIPSEARCLSEYDALMASAPTVLDAIPGAVYLCDHQGWLVRYNAEAAKLWGRSPPLGEPERFCGSYRLFLPDGTPLAHEDCPMATAISTGESTRNAEAIMERPDGSRIVVLVNIRALRDHQGRIQGAINCFQDITAQKAIEEELRRKSSDLEDFFGNSAIALHIVDADGIIIRANDSELALLGYALEEYVGQHISQFHVDAAVIDDILRRLSCGEILHRSPARLRAKDGSIKHVLITSNSRFENGALVNAHCFTTDVTGLHEAKSARRESDERLAATYEAATVGIAEADAQGRLLRVNDAVCTMLGRPREELLSTSFFDYTHEDDREEDAALYARQVCGNLASYVLRKRARKPDGTTTYLDIHSSSVRDDAGAFRYGVRVIQDVTEAKLLEDCFRERERLMRDLLEALPAAVFTTDADGRITFYNKAAVEMSGRRPALGEMWHAMWRLYYPDGTRMRHDDYPLAVTLRENRAVRDLEALAERPDGTRIPFIPFPTPLQDADGKLVGAINMVVDISERKQAEDRQKLLIGELNHRVKNTLATVQALARQSACRATSIEDFTQRFEARLFAVSRAHDLLTMRHWQDAPLDAIARAVLMPLAGEAAGRISVEGPALALNPRAALSLTMALSELATNAAKYGALSLEAGTLCVSWRLHEGTQPTILNLEWREHGGPPVAPPTQRGFGIRLIESCIERDLTGQLELAFDPSGLICRIAIPVEEVVA